MSQFRDYLSAFSEARSVKTKNNPYGIDFDDFESVYRFELERLDSKKDLMTVSRLQSELYWYRNKRPYFNVYPLIERKLLEIDKDVNCSELSLPFSSIEVRTSNVTFLLSITSKCLFFVVEMKDGYQEFACPKSASIKELVEAPLDIFEGESWPRPPVIKYLSDKQRHECLILGAGVCMLSRDKNLVVPVILNKHRKENMTPAEIAEYAEKATKRTGKTGFDVGKDIERMKATVHYRNGHFAKFHVGKDHEQFPVDSELSKVPIIKWRCGAVVNKKNTPTVPTGFKDA